MQPWSDKPIHPNFSVKFFVDTNILAYLVDETYTSLTEFISQSRDCGFIELVSSNFVIFEFVGIRKREHYLRKMVTASKKTKSGEINFSSLLKYQNKFEADGLDFSTVISDIKKDIEAELQTISTAYKINYDFSVLHEGQLTPTFEICLSTRMNNQDCLVLISSILPTPKTPISNIQLFTNDTDFVSESGNVNIDTILAANKLNKPSVHAIKNVPGQGTTVINLTSTHDAAKIKTHLAGKVAKLLEQQNDGLFLGVTFTPKAGFPDGIICFKFRANTSVPTDLYITVISKDLEFIYTSKNKIDFLWHNGKQIAKGHTFAEGEDNNVSCKLSDRDDQGNEIPIDKAIVAAILNEGNLVFIHPDS